MKINKIAIIFVIVVITLAVLIQVDYYNSGITYNNDKEKNVSYVNLDGDYYNVYTMHNIQYKKDSSLSLNDNRLISAILNKNAADVKSYIKEIYSDIEYTYIDDYNTFKIPLIVLAINSGSDEIIDTVLSNQYIDVNVLSKIKFDKSDGKTSIITLTPLAYAVFTNNLPLAQKLIDHGADVNKLLTGNRTALFYANSEDTINLLLNNGADINILSYQGNSPLMQAVNRNNIEAASALITNGINPNHHNNANATPLTAAINKKNINMINMLLSNGADVDYFVPDGQSPLMIAVSNADLQIFNILVNNGADVNKTNNLGKTCIFYMQSLKEQWIVWRSMIQTIKNDVNINHQDIDGNTVLHINPERYLLFRDLKPDLNIQNSSGNTPLHIIIESYNNTDLVKLFLKNGALKNIKNKQDKTPLDIALEQDKIDLVDILYKKDI